MSETRDHKSKGFRQLLVWNKAHELSILVYRLSQKYPKSELFGITSQIRRAAVSVAANIAEGYCSGSTGNYKRYLLSSRGSLAEVEYYLLLCRDIDYLSVEEYQQAEGIRREVGYLLHRLIESLR